MGHSDLTTLLLALTTLLVAARICGEIARRLGQAEVLGEILAGVLIGPTILGRFAPEVQRLLFPAPGTPAAITLTGIEQLAVGLFLFVAGMEVSLAAVRREGGRALTVSVGGLLVPFGIGLGVAMAAPELVGAVEGGSWGFALFFAVAMSISALPVIARTLIDLGIYRSGIGAVVIPSAIIMDLVGWLAFAVVLSLVDRASAGPTSVAQTVMLTLGFCAIMLTVGRWLIDRVLPWVQAYLSWPGGVLGFAFALALGCAAFTEWIGLHAIFGAFVAGVALGDSPHLRPRTRLVLEDFVRSFFAPLFFAGIGLKADLIGNFAPLVVASVFAIACAGKLIGCGLAGLLSGMDWRSAGAVAMALNARGAMEIVLASIALRFNLIGQTTFVALVVTALVTSLIAGPAIKRLLALKPARGLAGWLPAKAFVRRLQSSDRGGAVRELVRKLKAGESIGITPDGPRGPVHVAQDGVIALARLSGAAILPAAVSVSNRIKAKTWDRLIVGLPFSRGAMVWGNPIVVPRDCDEATARALQQRLQDELNRVSAAADEAADARA